MRYSLLNYLVCPETRSELICVVIREQPATLAHVRFSDCGCIPQEGAAVGPIPQSAGRTPVTELLRPLACTPAEPARNNIARVREGLLIAPDTGRWYPIREFIPELLPDHLRNFDRDFAFLAAIAPSLPTGLFDLLTNRAVFTRSAQASQDSGISYKVAEMSITDRIEDPGCFFGPGYVAPFNPGSTEHNLHLLRMFGLSLPLFWNGSRRVILDSGCGYSWTTDWMLQMGFEPIGIDISRVYLDIAVARLGDQLPYVMVADTEKMPIRDEVLDGVLGFDAFHHIPDRKGAMKEYYRTLKNGGRIVLAEPPSAHEHVPAVQEVMRKYGTLEKGMDLKDVRSYVQGTGLEDPVQHYIIDVQHTSVKAKLSEKFLQEHSYNPAYLFTIDKNRSIFDKIRGVLGC